ncbi:hypothetical protein [Paenibacillus ihuae]|uniref:hypothetical protein n=1 Tax=Paenibacillus ihuae TaxID=1232431 RepID=UPI000AE4F41F|nr:hypothetical protein [Paenibacillus ihuae]
MDKIKLNLGKKGGHSVIFLKRKRYQQMLKLVIVIFLMYDAFKQSFDKLAFSKKGGE